MQVSDLTLRCLRHFARCLAVLLLPLVPPAQAAPGAPVLSPPLRVAPGRQLTWSFPTATLQPVLPQFCDDLTGHLWLAPDWNIPGPLDDTTWTDSDPLAGTSRFYRLVAVDPGQRGRLIESTSMGSLTAQEVGLGLQLGGIEFDPEYGVETWRLVYETIDPLGNPTVASGALVVPLDAPGPLPFASYQHGTLASRAEAPSQPPSQDGNREILLGLAFASLGYVVALPDYLGLGVSPLVQPYHHAKSEATTCVDMLRAGREFGTNHSLPLSGQLFLVGYSHGGHATMALLRALETFHADEFTVTAAAPMAGAYDLGGVPADSVLSGDPQPNPYYFALLLAGFQATYHFADNLADLLQAPYDTTLPPLLDGTHTGGQINAAMPARVLDILQPTLANALRNDPNHPVRVALRHNSLIDWKPYSPLRLYHCSGDQDVPFANTVVAYESFLSQGATQVEMINPVSGANHSGCVEPSLRSALDWFQSLREPPTP
ncbi:MAG: hypothetical protein KDM81_03165 [Verrucomicrobiae bacterium]|nr:hypothetical protein [Verrucomicrobiae bacterium]